MDLSTKSGKIITIELESTPKYSHPKQKCSDIIAVCSELQILKEQQLEQ